MPRLFQGSHTLNDLPMLIPAEGCHPDQGKAGLLAATATGKEEPFIDTAHGVAGFSLLASVAVKVSGRKKLEWICRWRSRRYISRPAVSEKRLSLTRQGIGLPVGVFGAQKHSDEGTLRILTARIREVGGGLILPILHLEIFMS